MRKLDLIVTPDNTLRCWKDEDELEHAASLGVLDADEVRAEADRVVAVWPFPTGLNTWPSCSIATTPLDPAHELCNRGCT